MLSVIFGLLLSSSAFSHATILPEGVYASAIGCDLIIKKNGEGYDATPIVSPTSENDLSCHGHFIYWAMFSSYFVCEPGELENGHAYDCVSRSPGDRVSATISHVRDNSYVIIDYFVSYRPYPSVELTYIGDKYAPMTHVTEYESDDKSLSFEENCSLASIKSKKEALGKCEKYHASCVFKSTQTFKTSPGVACRSFSYVDGN